MKGIIAKCLEGVVNEKFGPAKWREILADAGLPEDASFALTDDVDDAIILTAVGSACQVLGLTLEQLADAFGSYWIMQFTTKHYSPVYALHKNARQLLTGMNAVHEQAVKFMPGAAPPRFDFEWQDANTLLVEYTSARGLIDFAVGITRGLGEYYGEALEVEKLSDTRFRVVFP